MKVAVTVWTAEAPAVDHLQIGLGGTGKGGVPCVAEEGEEEEGD